jgi:hypothetical protein
MPGRDAYLDGLLENSHMASIEIGQQTLHFDDTGGSGPPVLFCHSFGMNGAMFSPQLTAFAGRYRCITWDQRGHGQSPASGPFTLWDSARDALALLDRLEMTAPSSSAPVRAASSHCAQRSSLQIESAAWP